MTRAEIDYLKKAGYTIAEIMAMENETVPQPDKEESKEEPKEESKPVEEKTAANDNATLLEQLAELRGELKAMRETVHAQNRQAAVIETPKPPTREENIEELLAEVNK